MMVELIVLYLLLYMGLRWCRAEFYPLLLRLVPAIRTSISHP
jgi:hypothetical protein